MNLCIVKHNEIGLTETFIRAHIERIPEEITVVHGTPPRFEGERIEREFLPRRVARVLRERLGEPLEHHERLEGRYTRLLKACRAEVVLAEYGIAGVYVMESCRKLGLPLIVHFHGHDASRQSVLDQYAEAYPRLFRQAAAIVAVSRAMRAKLIELGAPPEKVYLNHYGVDLHAFEASRPSAAPPTFLAVGRMVEKKAPHLLLLAFARAHEKHPEARLRIVGDGPLLSVCQELADGLGVKNAVTFLGAQSHEVVRKEMQAVRAFVQHSVIAASGDSEGTPNSVLEASASGLPVLSTRHAGIPDVVVEEETGLLVDERDVDGMVGHMVRVLEEPALADRLGQAARQRIGEHFAIDTRIDALWDIIRDAAESPKIPSGQAA